MIDRLPHSIEHLENSTPIQIPKTNPTVMPPAAAMAEPTSYLPIKYLEESVYPMAENPRKELIKAILDGIIGLVIFLASAFVYIMQKNSIINFGGFVDPSVPSIVIALTLFNWKRIWDNNKNEILSERNREKIIAQQKVDFDIISSKLDRTLRSREFYIYRSVEDCVQYLEQKCPIILDVKNTCVVTSPDIALETYMDEFNGRVIDQVLAIVTSGHEWRDVVSSNMIEPRVTKIRDKIKDSGTKYGTRYSARKLKKDIAIINFLIVTYKGKSENSRDKEVIFGFGLHDVKPNDNVIITSNPEIVSIFEDYHSSLRRYHCDDI